MTMTTTATARLEKATLAAHLAYTADRNAELPWLDCRVVTHWVVYHPMGSVAKGVACVLTLNDNQDSVLHAERELGAENVGRIEDYRRLHEFGRVAARRVYWIQEEIALRARRAAAAGRCYGC